ncbi:MAG: cell division protein FtsA [Elusimicrobia bacterium]|nr:cell division protein FtsA [Elusimicrobiota bacterium]
MPKSDIVAGLDIGSGRVTCVIAEYNPEIGKIKILSGSSVACKGLKGGVVINISEASKSIMRAMEEAEEKAKDMIGEVYLGVRGYHIQSFNNRGAYNVARTDREITAEDVSNVIENAKTISLSSDREILHVIPQGFSLDKQKGVPNPVGMEGNLLEVSVHIVTASASHINNLLKSVANAGFKVVETIYAPIALGEIVVSPEEKDLGCLLIDLGGQTTSVCAYYEGSLYFSREIPIGGDHITKDMAHALRTSMNTAQYVKEKHGAVLSTLVEAEQTVTVTGLDGRTSREIKPKDLLDYIQPRVEEIYDKINVVLQGSNYADLPGGAVLTGGGSLLKGMPEAAEQILDLQQARIGLPRNEMVDCPEEYLNPVYTTAMALVCYPYFKSWLSEGSLPGKTPAWWRRTMSWLKEVF